MSRAERFEQLEAQRNRSALDALPPAPEPRRGTALAICDAAADLLMQAGEARCRARWSRGRARDCIRHARSRIADVRVEQLEAMRTGDVAAFWRGAEASRFATVNALQGARQARIAAHQDAQTARTLEARGRRILAGVVTTDDLVLVLPPQALANDDAAE